MWQRILLTESALGSEKVRTASMRFFRTLHNIKNHLSSMNLLVRLLEPGVKETPYQQYISRLKKEILSIQELISATAGPDKREIISLANFLKELEEELELRTQHAGVNVIIDLPKDPPSLYCNPEAVAEAFRNVWENALEAMPSGGTLYIKVYQDKSNLLKIAFTDTGSGIPQEILSNVSTPFFSTKPHGLGLGLTIAQAVVMSHGGSLDIVSNSSGTTITFNFPNNCSNANHSS